MPQCPARPATLSYRSARFDLDSLYGAGPGSQPGLMESDGIRFRLGLPFTRDLESTSGLSPATDLPRNGADAVVADARNDSQRILAQVHDVLMRFHNRVARNGLSFEQTQKEVRLHYQWLVVHDFLRQILQPPLQPKAGEPLRLDFELFPVKAEAGAGAQAEPFIPLEFSVGAFRFGHAMARAAYRLNRTLPTSFTVLGPERWNSLFGFAPVPPLWGIDWDLFIDLSGNLRRWQGQGRLQLAHQIDTALVNPLGNIPVPKEAGAAGTNLALRDLLRGRGLRLPSGQAVALQMGLVALRDDEILIGGVKLPITQVHPSLAGNCPLWVYVLAEATPHETQLQTADGEQTLTTRKLGPVGGRIVLETVLRLLHLDPDSLAHRPDWAPSPNFTRSGVFGLRELIQAALADGA